MDWTTYISTLRSRIAGMQRSGAYEVRFEKWPGLTAAIIDDIDECMSEEEGMGQIHVLNDMRAFYSITNGLYLYWVFLGDDPVAPPHHPMASATPMGHADLVFLPLIYEPPVIAGQPDIPYSNLYDDYRLFDRADGQNHVYLRFNRDKRDPDFYYKIRETGAYHLLALDFTRYMELFLECRGLIRWQEFFIADPAYRVDPLWETWFHVNLATLFPDTDPSRFRR